VAVPATDPSSTLRLRAPGRYLRTAVLAALTLAFVLGSVVGQDSWWPFSPWRMFSTSTPPSGTIVSLAVQVRTADEPEWHDTALTPASIGLNRAEVEGRSGVIQAHPAMLGTLAASHARLRPHDAPWTAARLVRRQTVLHDRRPTGEVITTQIATWSPR
jgi:hypothetical protein